MDKDRVDGLADQAKGGLKQAAGKLTGNEKLEAEGAAQKAGGKVEEGVGKGKDAIRDVAKG